MRKLKLNTETLRVLTNPVAPSQFNTGASACAFTACGCTENTL